MTSPLFRVMLSLILIGSCNRLIAQDLYVSQEQRTLQRMSSQIDHLSASTAFGEHINLQTGDLSFRHVDVELAGNGPLLTISRRFNVSSSSAWNWRHDLAFADWDIEIPRITTNTTTGANDWLVVGSSPTARCTNFGAAANLGAYNANYWWRGVHLEIPGQSRQELMLRSTQNPIKPTMLINGVQPSFDIVTKNNWAITCIATLQNGAPGEGFLALAPDGTKYWFDRMAYHFESYANPPVITYLLPTDEFRASLLVTRIEDRFGNYLTYSYTNNLLTEINASDGRSIKISWSGNRGGFLGAFYHINTITENQGLPSQRVWQYSYLYRGVAMGSNVAPRWDLVAVVLPDQSSWKFTLGELVNSCYDNAGAPGCKWQDTNGTSNGISGSIENPSGVKATYKMKGVGAARYGQYAVAPPATPWPNNANPQLGEMDPQTFQAPSVKEKTLSGPGISPATWLYSYTGKIFKPGELVTAGRVTQHPNGTAEITFFDSAWGSPTEGQVVRIEKYAGAITGNPVYTESYEYAAIPSRIGNVPRSNSNSLGEEFAWPIKKRVIQQDGRTFTYSVESFDNFARPIMVVKSSSP